MSHFSGAARDSEEVEEVEADSAPPQSAQAASRLHQPQRVPSHAGLPAALRPGKPDGQRTPGGHRGDVIQVAIGSPRRSIMDPGLVLTAN